MNKQDPAFETKDGGDDSPGIVSEMVLVAVAELGPDISYIRVGQSGSEGRAYLTGVEVGVVVGAGVVASFLSGAAKGFAEGFGEAVGKKVGEAVYERMNKLRERIVHLLKSDSSDFAAEYKEIGQELQSAHAELLPFESGLSKVVQESTTHRQVLEVHHELLRYGFTERKVLIHRTEVVKKLSQMWRER